MVVRSGDDGLLLLASATSFWQVVPFRWDMFPPSIPWPMTEPPLLDDVHSILSSHHHGHQNGQQSGFIFIRYFVCCRPDTEQVAAQWRLPGASGVALAMLYWVMSGASLQRVPMAIKMACNGGTLLVATAFFAWHNLS